MDDLDKLAKLLRHWMEHNDEHAETYREWARKTAQWGRDDVSTVLQRLHDETRKTRGIFEEALHAIQQVR
jgi:Asp-tRNA(Asn)/Glu-tRNA(Gln) amidotransferase B subunit